MTELDYKLWEPVIGLEIHCQLKTRTKLFSSAPNRFGDEPNTNVGIVDTGQPGTLPKLNREAVRKAVMFGCAIDADITPTSTFDRKSYFYPDSPRNFQITQFYHPIIRGGHVIADGKTFPISHAHLEDDAGMLRHFSSFAGVDFNRAGVPLIEIVSEPCMHSPKEATAYATAIRAIMEYLGASDCNMEEGSLRIDVNVSVRKKGETALRTKCEIKNLNSFTTMELAIEAEIRRQIFEYTEHPNREIESATYRFDLETGQTVLMRSKIEAMDYRYCPEPDLPPLVLTPEYIDEIRSNLPELPQARYNRYIELGLGEYNASLLVNDKALSDYFEEALAHTSHTQSLVNWVTVEFVGRLKDSGKHLAHIGLPPIHIATLVNLIHDGTISGKIAKKVADEMMVDPSSDPKTIVSNNPDYQPLSDVATIEPIIDQVLADNPQSITDYHAGKDRAFNYLVGQIMKLTKGKASPDVVKELLSKKLC